MHKARVAFDFFQHGIRHEPCVLHCNVRIERLLASEGRFRNQLQLALIFHFLIGTGFEMGG